VAGENVMGLKNYRLVVGRAMKLAEDDDASPHLEILLDVAGANYRVAANVRSSQHPHPLLYQRRDPFADPLTARLGGLPPGIVDVRHDRSDLALDYVRGGMVSRADMKVAPYKKDGPDNDLRDYLLPLLGRAINDPAVRVFAFGETWGPEAGQPDTYFGFEPGRGVHDIHMNQGSAGSHKGTNGPNQDGALLVHFGGDDRWIAVFLAFQSQSWNTDPRTGHPLAEDPPRDPIDRSPDLDAPIEIIAALVNPPNPEEGRETVTLLNRTDAAVDLTGWAVTDRMGRATPLDGIVLEAGETARMRLDASATRLGNKEGEIVLIDGEGAVVHRVRYAGSDLGPEGWTVAF
jgi:uncharacterized protein YukJ